MRNDGFALRLLLLVLGCGACADGQVQQTALATECAPDDDACAQESLAAPLAVGARLTLDVDVPSNGGIAPIVHLEPVDEQVAFIEEGFVVGVGEGVTALLVAAADGAVVDLTHLSVAAPTRLSVQRGDDHRDLDDRFSVAAEETVTLRVRARTDAQVLLGTFELGLSADNDEFFVSAPAIDEVRLVAPQSGTTSMVLSALGLSRTFHIEVTP